MPLRRHKAIVTCMNGQKLNHLVLYRVNAFDFGIHKRKSLILSYLYEVQLTRCSLFGIFLSEQNSIRLLTMMFRRVSDHAAQPPGIFLPADGVAAPESVSRGVVDDRPGARSRLGGCAAPGFLTALMACSPRVRGSGCCSYASGCSKPA